MYWSQTFLLGTFNSLSLTMVLQKNWEFFFVSLKHSIPDHVLLYWFSLFCMFVGLSVFLLFLLEMDDWVVFLEQYLLMRAWSFEAMTLWLLCLKIVALPMMAPCCLICRKGSLLPYVMFVDKLLHGSYYFLIVHMGMSSGCILLSCGPFAFGPCRKGAVKLIKIYSHLLSWHDGTFIFL